MASRGTVVFAFFCIVAVVFGKPQPPQPCVVDGQTIQPGAHFYMDCSGSCYCGSGNIFSCVPLCPLEHYACSPGTEPQFEDNIIETGTKRCRCPMFVGCF